MKLLVTAFVTLLVSPIIIFAGIVTYKSLPSYSYKDSQAYSVGNTKYSPDDVKYVKINWNSGNVLIEETGANKLIISEIVRSSKTNLTNNQKLHWLIKDKKLVVHPSKSGKSLKNVKKDLLIQIPKNLDDVSLYIHATDTTLNKITAKRLAINTVASNIHNSETTAKNIFIDAIASSVSIDLTDDVENVKIKSIANNINLNLLKNAGAIIKASGSISTVDEKSFLVSKNLNLTTGKGKCKINANIITTSLKVNKAI